MEENGFTVDNKSVIDLKAEGKAIVIVATGKAVLGVIALSDTLKDNAKE